MPRENEAARVYLPRSLVTAALLLLLVHGLACRKADKPPSLPLTQAFNRMVPRTELVPLIVRDPARAERVRQLHIEVESLLLDAARAQAEKLSEVLVRDEPDPSDDQVREIFAANFADGRKTLDAYIALQMQIREHTTAEEFARLSQVR